jgi:tetraacyldisaccharide 4'-kinase
MNSAFSTYWRELANGSKSGLADRMLILLMAPLSLVYSLVQRARVALYNFGILKTRRLPRPVISVGNITVGGTGKTPITAYFARLLINQGYRVAVLSRGYGGSLEGHTVVVSDGATVMLGPEECGDEPYLLASTIPGLMVIIGTDRYTAGELAMQQLSPDLFLLDDGFQHLRLHRDLNILLLDFNRPFGNHYTLPAGILRESSDAASRADQVIFTRAPHGISMDPVAAGIPCCISHHTIVDFLPLYGSTPVSFPECACFKVLAFAGIASPDSFFDELRTKGMNVVYTISFPDHTAYVEADLLRIAEEMKKSGARYAVTTEKDGVKLKDLWNESNGELLMARLEIIIDDPVLLTENLLNLLQK